MSRCMMIVVLLCLAASPASQPTSRPARQSITPVSFADLRKQIAELQAQVAALQAENAALRAELAARDFEPDDNGDRFTRAIADHRLVEGMTLDQANASLRPDGYSPPKLVDEPRDDVQVYEWTKGFKDHHGVVNSWRIVRATIRNGTVVGISVREE